MNKYSNSNMHRSISASLIGHDRRIGLFPVLILTVLLSFSFFMPARA